MVSCFHYEKRLSWKLYALSFMGLQRYELQQYPLLLQQTKRRYTTYLTLFVTAMALVTVVNLTNQSTAISWS